MKTYLNLGCGNRRHSAWTNIDFTSNSKEVIVHNLLNGIPFPDNSFDVVYHSHILEHFTKSDGLRLMKECFIVLKPNGIMRLATPNLEEMAELYLQKLRLANEGDEKAHHDYEWMLIELYDQATRTESGGEMAKYFFQEKIPNEEFVYKRLGEEAMIIRAYYIESKNMRPADSSNNPTSEKKALLRSIMKQPIDFIKNYLKSRLFKGELAFYNQFYKEAQLGRFRLSGEVHLHMYDSYSLQRLFSQVGFTNFEVVSAFKSKIPIWDSYQLETKNGQVLKPESIFVEAIKPNYENTAY